MLLGITKDTILGARVHMALVRNPRYVKEPFKLWWNYATCRAVCQTAHTSAHPTVEKISLVHQKAMGETCARKTHTAPSTFSSSFKSPTILHIGRAYGPLRGCGDGDGCGPA